MSDIQLSVVIPLYNEADGLDELYVRLKPVLNSITPQHEIIFVNDGSADQTLQKVKALAHKDSAIRFVSFSRNFGHQIAVTAGLKHSTGKAVAIMDADLQDPPEVLVPMYAQYKAGFKVVLAKRKSRKGESFFKKATAKLFYRVLSAVTHFDIPLDTGDFRIIDRKVVEIINEMPENSRFIRGQIAWAGFKSTSVEFDRDERVHGHTSYTLTKMLKFAFDGITGFSSWPLKLASIAGFVVSFVSFLVIIYSLVMRFFSRAVITGWTSLMVSVLFVGGIQLLALGVIGEYISRINLDVKRRPLYIIEETDREN